MKHINRSIHPILFTLLLACDSGPAPEQTDDADLRAGLLVPQPGPDGWGAGDELGNGNTQSYGTRLRCATRLLDPGARVYELGHTFSSTMPQTQMDALGHFGVLPEIWNPLVEPEPQTDAATYKLTITCRGSIVGDDGLIFDNARIDEVLQVIVAALDHRNLNEMKTAFADNPTAERLVAWIWDLAANVPLIRDALWRVELEEGDRSVFAVQREEGELAARVTAFMRQMLRNDPAPNAGEP